MRRLLVAITVVLLAVSLLSLALFTVACGGSSTATTGGAGTTIGVTTTAAGATSTSGAAIDAATLYAQNCAECHKNGVNGSADDVAAITRSGTGGMPSFTDKLSADEIAALAEYAANGGK